MSIRVKCPNGHELKVKSSMAGKSGLCPICRAVVQVPVPKDPLEDSILDMLRTIKPAVSSEGESAETPLAGTDGAGHRSPSHRVDVHDGLPAAVAPKKSCIRCHREIDLGTHICPHCHTYIASVADFGLR